MTKPGVFRTGCYVIGVALSSCASAPAPSELDPREALRRAESLLEANDAATALDELQAIDEAVLVGDEIEQFEFLHATALFRTGDPWDAYEEIEDFQENHRFSELLDAVEELHFDCGRALIESDRSFWIFGSDATDGAIVLTDFVTRYSTHAHMPDALKLLGEHAFREGRYQRAAERFKQIKSEYGNTSEWAALAHFRLTMCGYLQLSGPRYDLDRMHYTRNELRDYLQTAPERPEFRDSATAALDQTEDWIAQRHAVDAGFYRRIDQRIGELTHLRLLVSEFPDHELAVEARQRIAELEAETPAPLAADSDSVAGSR